MAKDKKSFILYCDLIHTVKKLPKDKQADLFVHILDYVNDENPITEDIVIEIAFEPIKQQLKRDLVKYEGMRAKNRANALKRWEQGNATASDGIQMHANDAVNDNDSDILTTERSLQLFSLNPMDLPEGYDFKHSTIAIGLYKILKQLNPDNQYLNTASFDEWHNTIRKLKELDGKSYSDFVKVGMFLKEGLNDKPNGDVNFWIDNLKTVPALRKKNGEGIRKIDNILTKVNRYITKNEDFEVKVINEINQLKATFNG